MEQIKKGEVYTVNYEDRENVSFTFTSKVTNVTYPWGDSHIGEVSFANGVRLIQPNAVTFVKYEDRPIAFG
jgi:hypothetical protein